MKEYAVFDTVVENALFPIDVFTTREEAEDYVHLVKEKMNVDAEIKEVE
jgi:hypothetical protein